MTDPGQGREQEREQGREARITPWELVFGAPTFDDARFDAIREWPDSAQATTAAALLMLPPAGELLRELLPADAGGGASGPDAIAQAGALLFHAYRFWLHERGVWEIGADPLARVLEAGAGDWRFAAPAAAGYVQLPHHLFWARVEDEAAPEPVDGFFWSAPTAAPDGAADRLDLLLVLGLRRGRPGVSLVEVGVEPAQQLEDWAVAQARPDGEDFANILPGGELKGYRALTTPAEVLKLAVFCFHLIDTLPGRPAEGGAVHRIRVDG